MPHVPKRQPKQRRDVGDVVRLRRRVALYRRNVTTTATAATTRHQQKCGLAARHAKTTPRLKYPLQVQGPRPQSNVRRKLLVVYYY